MNVSTLRLWTFIDWKDEEFCTVKKFDIKDIKKNFKTILIKCIISYKPYVYTKKDKKKPPKTFSMLLKDKTGTLEVVFRDKFSRFYYFKTYKRKYYAV